MTSRLLALALALGALVACGKLPANTAALNEPCSRTADCATNLVCTNGKCVVDEGQVCEPASTRCNGMAVEKCRQGGDGWDSQEVCQVACSEGACLPPVCEANQKKCQGTLVLQCLDSGAGWVFFQSCPTECDPATFDCKRPTCTPFETRCKAGSSSTVQVCNGRGTGFTDQPCPTDNVCLDNRCVPKVCSTVGSGAGAVRDGRCRGDVREECNDQGTGWNTVEACAFGCAAEGSRAACADAVCQPGAQKCDGDGVVRCAPDQRSFAFVQFCPAGCQTPASGQPSCVAPTCAPLTRRCAADPVSGAPIVEQCNAAGTRWEASESCPQACVNGACVLQTDGCSAGDRRCNGKEAEVCVQLAAGGTAWRFEERCLGACLGGACDTAGACGCEGGGAGPTRCGTGGKAPITLAALVPAGASLPADGISTVLVHTDPIVDAQGTPVPDGTLVTFTHDGVDGLFASGDADPTRPGLQRPTSRGRARVLVRAPPAARDVLVSATLGGSCAGQTTVKFVQVSASGSKSIYVAEDFSTTRFLDRQTTTAQWDTVRGKATISPNFDLGGGQDGDLAVAANNSVDLWDAGYARAWGVASLGAQFAQLDSGTHGLAVGDDVLLVSLNYENAATSGTYEFKTVTAVEGSRLGFDSPVRGVYGATGNLDLAGQRVFLQRVPQFNNVTVDTGATLTSRAFVNGGTGILAFRVKGTLRVLGLLTMAERGLAPAIPQAGTSGASLGRLLLGAGGTKAGGGVLVVTGRTVTTQAAGSSSAVGLLSAGSTAGAGGMVWVAGGTLSLGADKVQATGSASGLDGRVRLDYGVIDSGASTRPAAAIGQGGAAIVQSLVEYTEPTVGSGTQPQIRSLTLLGTIGGAGRPVVGLPQTMPGVHVDASVDNGANWVNADAGRATFSPIGRLFRFRARLETLSDDAVDLQAASFRLDVN